MDFILISDRGGIRRTNRRTSGARYLDRPSTRQRLYTWSVRSAGEKPRGGPTTTTTPPVAHVFQSFSFSLDSRRSLQSIDGPRLGQQPATVARNTRRRAPPPMRPRGVSTDVYIMHNMQTTRAGALLTASHLGIVIDKRKCTILSRRWSAAHVRCVRSPRRCCCAQRRGKHLLHPSSTSTSATTAAWNSITCSGHVTSLGPPRRRVRLAKL
jgi:hypothetical protein